MLIPTISNSLLPPPSSITTSSKSLSTTKQPTNPPSFIPPSNDGKIRGIHLSSERSQNWKLWIPPPKKTSNKITSSAGNVEGGEEEEEEEERPGVKEKQVEEERKELREILDLLSPLKSPIPSSSSIPSPNSSSSGFSSSPWSATSSANSGRRYSNLIPSPLSGGGLNKGGGGEQDRPFFSSTNNPPPPSLPFSFTIPPQTYSTQSTTTTIPKNANLNGKEKENFMSIDTTSSTLQHPQSTNTEGGEVEVGSGYIFPSGDSEGFEKVLGEGSSQVKIGYHLLTGRNVAIKLLRKGEGEVAPSATIRELLILSSLPPHPNLMCLLQVIEGPSYIYMVMALEGGGELFHLLEKLGSKGEKLPEKEGKAIFSQLLTGVAYIHSQGIVHRDIKPENVLFSNPYPQYLHVKLCDFGFASPIGGGGFGLLKEFCGSSEYCAPEMIARKSYVGPEVDVWSLGVLLYVLLSTSLPFSNPNHSKLFLSIMTGKYQPLPSYISEDARKLVTKILIPKVAGRATLSQIQEDQWFKGDSGTSPSSSPFHIPTYPLNIRQEILQTMAEDFHIPLEEVEAYQNQGGPGKVKTCVYLLEEMFIPRGEKRKIQEGEDSSRIINEGGERMTALEVPSHFGVFTSSSKEKLNLLPSANNQGRVPSLTPLDLLKRRKVQTSSHFREATTKGDSFHFESMKVTLHSLEKEITPFSTIPTGPTKSYQHISSKKSLHMTILQKILKLDGKFPYTELDDENHQMCFVIPWQRGGKIDIGNVINLEGMEEEDAEVQRILFETLMEGEGREEVQMKILVTTTASTPPSNINLTVFQLQSDKEEVGIAPPDWIKEGFEEICDGLMNDVE